MSDLTAPRRESLPSLLRRALSGESDEDFTTGSIGRAVLLLSVPMVLEMAMESVFAVCDVFYVSRLGVDAVAAVGLTEAVITLVYAVAVGLSAAGTAMVARRVGEKQHDAAATASGQLFLMGLLASVPIMLAGLFFAPRILAAMGGEPALVAQGAGYTRVMLAGSATILSLFTLNAALRGAGDAVWSMRTLWLANGINLVLDPALIWGWGPLPEMGLTGAAVATTIGRGVGVALQLAVLFGGRGRLELAWSHLRPRRAILGRLARVSVAGIGQYLVSTSSWVGLVRIVSTFGSEAVAGYTVAIRIVIFALLPSWGVSNAAATLVGQNLGAGAPDRAEKSVWYAARLNMALMTTVALAFIIFARPLVSVFLIDAAAVAVGVACLRLLSLGNPLYAWGMVLAQAFNGAGDTRTPLRLNVICFWLLQLPLAWWLARHTGLGVKGVFLGVVLAELALTVLGARLFRQGEWKTREI
ncbi:MATE family efflux transporter [bacterium]|nr:MATE family efflux transporter [bacterium]HPF36909.1 MATE family efflux transporter [Candidatus Krumholzibacteria bacterium]HRX52767.1 MATE family efflux transporter [Candidatus Krumholzibacteria bacterium]